MQNALFRFPAAPLFSASFVCRSNSGGLPFFTTSGPNSSRRRLAMLSAALVAALLHGCLLFCYLHRPAPLPFAAAAPLPMIDMMLSAPPSPAVNQPIAPPTPLPPKITPKPDPKPLNKPKPKPKPLPAETKTKQVDPQKEEPVSAPPVSSAPPSENHERMAAPRNDTYVPADSNANYLNNPKPVYPLLARQRQWEGLVLLRVHITADGHVDQVAVQRSSGHEVLDESALEAVRNWRFVPAKRGDFAEASWASVPIEFELN